MDHERLQRQLTFILETDKLKGVIRRTFVPGQDRCENSAEHSWQVALMACILAEHARQPVDACKVMKMMLVHDLVEIDAGDTYVYDASANTDKVEREQKAADRLFGLLPEDQAKELRALWEEFEARSTMEAKFARGLDRLMPMLHNYHTQGRSWLEHGITREQVEKTNVIMNDGSSTLWDYAKALIDSAVRDNFLNP
ncbi:HD domain-containing protein [bacterium]|nr:HD domain-containing protein [bacterium]